MFGVLLCAPRDCWSFHDYYGSTQDSLEAKKGGRNNIPQS